MAPRGHRAATNSPQEVNDDGSCNSKWGAAGNLAGCAPKHVSHTKTQPRAAARKPAGGPARCWLLTITMPVGPQRTPAHAIDLSTDTSTIVWSWRDQDAVQRPREVTHVVNNIIEMSDTQHRAVACRSAQGCETRYRSEQHRAAARSSVHLARRRVAVRAGMRRGRQCGVVACRVAQ